MGLAGGILQPPAAGRTNLHRLSRGRGADASAPFYVLHADRIVYLVPRARVRGAQARTALEGARAIFPSLRHRRRTFACHRHWTPALRSNQRYARRERRRSEAMKRSSERILTTHTGSLPRPDHLLPLLRAKEAGEVYDPAILASHVRSAVAEAVQMQIAAGIDIVNDGEMSKPSYATYIKDRLAGFEGEKSSGLRAADLG